MQLAKEGSSYLPGAHCRARSRGSLARTRDEPEACSYAPWFVRPRVLGGNEVGAYAYVKGEGPDLGSKDTSAAAGTPEH